MPNCRDIVWVNYPFSDQVNIKHRPAVLISGRNSFGDVICLPITSTNHSNSFRLSTSDIESPQPVGLDLARVIFSSYVSLEQPMTLTTSHIENDDNKILAKITDAAYQRIKSQLSAMNCN